MNSRFRTTPTAFSIGVNITITNPDVIVVVIMFTFFLREEKGPLLLYKKLDDKKKLLHCWMCCVFKVLMIINKGLLIIVNGLCMYVCRAVKSGAAFFILFYFLLFKDKNR